MSRFASRIRGRAPQRGANIAHRYYLGLFSDFTPKFVKRYAELGGVVENAAKAYAEDVHERRFPEPVHCFGVPKDKGN